MIPASAKSLVAAALASTAIGVSHAQAPESDYPNPQVAYNALRNDPGARFEKKDGWLVVQVKTGPNEGVWFFTPQGHPAFPAYVRRVIVDRNGDLHLALRVKCGAEKAICDDMVARFQEMNEQMARDLRKR